jgi:putative endonuclease
VDPEVVEVAGSARGQRSAELGRWGEDLAAEQLAAGGLRCSRATGAARRASSTWSGVEADGTVVFVEVKTRAGHGLRHPAEAVGWRKAGRIRRLACAWLAEHRPPGTTGLRFDVVGHRARPGAPPEVTHLRGAF